MYVNEQTPFRVDLEYPQVPSRKVRWELLSYFKVLFIKV
jgi:hypothetical protein